MSIAGRLMLRPDVRIVAVADLPADVRARISASDQDYTVTREHSRAPTSVLDRDSVEILEGFRTPNRIVDAVLSFAAKRGLDPEPTLEQIYPVLTRLFQARLLVPADSRVAGAPGALWQPGAVVGAYRLVRAVQSLDDAHVFLARDAAGRYAALKLVPTQHAGAIRALGREAELLARVPAGRAPQVLGIVRDGSGTGLATEWIFGSDALTVANSLRGGREPGSDLRLLELCVRVAGAFADVHAAGLLHGDVHPRNVLVEEPGAVRLIDLGLACEIGAPAPASARGGVPFYFDPQFAHAQRTGQPCEASCAAEQYSVAALLYQLWTGVHYLDWSLERGELLRQIVEDEPVAFQARRVAPWPELEGLLRRALQKDPSRRFADLRSLADALAALLPHAQARDRQAAVCQRDPAWEVDLLERTLGRYRLGGDALRDGPPDAPRASVNFGAGGIAYALLRIAQRREDPHLLALADLWSQKALALAASNDAFYNEALQIGPGTVGERSLFHSAAGLHCVRALVSAAQGDCATANLAMRALVDHSRGPNDGLDPVSALDAVLGKASVLLGCSELLEAVPDCAAFERVQLHARGEELAREVLAFLQPDAIGAAAQAVPLGIAHGWGGLLYALLRWARAAGREPPVAVSEGLQRLEMLAEPQGAGMRWPVAPGSPSYLDGWCNGAAGHAMLFALAYRVLGEPRLAELAERAATGAWNGDITLGTLCCGQAGIGYALLAVHRITGSPQWLQRARVCARRAAADRSPHFLRDALYKGAVGAALLAEQLHDPSAAAMPLFEPLR